MRYAAVAELADAQDLKSCGTNLPYRFDSGLRHCKILDFSRVLFFVLHILSKCELTILDISFDFSSGACLYIAFSALSFSYPPRYIIMHPVFL